ncbi:MAG: Asp-tRNA(Asn)/Glu-tRNA(Gln) amidotransferase GatCAB subunit A [Legionellales bacterium]|nr:Asp-tRNA(Asn)/Glu-tRNA(Gln) amidotransferase GatCAB subunit A [Legionellales bacterium]
MKNLHTQSIRELIKLIENRLISAYELTSYFCDRIQTYNSKINAVISFDKDIALDQAKQIDHRITKKKSSPLQGIPILQKDLICSTKFKTTCGSKMLANYQSPFNAHVVNLCDAEGLIEIGKTNMDEFAMGSSNETSYFGNVLNPWEHTRVPGGSSGGAAAAVAAGFAPLATGSDTGGSIRQPSSFCGLTGLKPTYGAVSRNGLIAFASSLDQIGPMAKSAEDCAYLMDVITKKDPKDSTSQQYDMQFVDYLKNDIPPKIKIGIPKELKNFTIDSSVEKAFGETVQSLKGLNVEFVEISLSSMELALPAYYIIAPAECSSNLARYNGALFGYRHEGDNSLQEMYSKTRTEGFGKEVKRRIIIGTFVLSKGFQGQYYQKALSLCHNLKMEFKKIFSICDFILTPTISTPAFEFNAYKNPVEMYQSDLFTIPANLCGLPAISFQAGMHGKLPIGAQLIGNHFKDHELLQLVHHFQKATGWHEIYPEDYQ